MLRSALSRLPSSEKAKKLWAGADNPVGSSETLDKSLIPADDSNSTKQMQETGSRWGRRVVEWKVRGAGGRAKVGSIGS